MARVFTDSTNNVAFTPGWSTLSAVTVAAWVYCTGGGGGGLGRIMQRSDADTGWKWYHKSGLPGFFFQWNNNEGVWDMATDFDGAWHHLAVTYVAGNTANDPVFYMDGISQTVTRTSGAAGTDDAGTLYIGNRASVNRGFAGSIADAAIWNRALNAQEILGAKINPWRVPSGLVFAAPLFGSYSPEPDYAGPLLGTVTGTTQGAHSPSGLMRPRRRTSRYTVVTALDNWFFLDSLTADSAWPKLQIAGTAPTTATTSTGWRTDGIAATQYARMAYNVIRAASVFGATAQPSGGPDSTLKDCWRTDTPITVNIPAGDWPITLPLIAVVGAGTTGRVRVRLWQSANADGSSATEITSGAVNLTTDTNLQIGTAQLSSGTVTLGAVAFTAKYLFVQVAFETM